MNDLDEVNHIADRICASPILRSRPTLSKLFRHLIKYGGTPSRLTPVAIEQEFGFRSPETVRIQCARLRAALWYYFLYRVDAQPSTAQLDVPAAASEEAEFNGIHKHYRVIVGKELHKAGGAEAFWRAHFMVRPDEHGDDAIFGTTIVFTEPLMFRDVKRRLFIRHLDVNDPKGAAAGDPVAELMRKAPWIKDPKSLVVSRGYVPGGEVIAKDALRAWFLRHEERVRNAAGHLVTPAAFVEERISRKIPDINALDDGHCILLGSWRANWVIRYFQNEAKHLLPFKIDENGIVVQGIEKEYHDIQERLMDLKGGDITENDLRKMIRRQSGTVVLREDWSKMSFALFSRVLDHSKKFVVSVLSANQGRGIQALAEHILVEDEPANEVLKVCGITGALPKAFQILFAIVLDDQESGYSSTRWKVLMYREVSAQRTAGRKQRNP